MPAFDFADFFRRTPDDDGPDLITIDGTDRFLLDEAPHVHGDALRHPGAVTVVDDQRGVLTLGVLAVHGADDVRVVQDSLVSERALESIAGTFGRRGFHHPETYEDAFTDARLVLLRLSKSHDRLDEVARAVARFAAPDVVLLCGGRTKYMTLSQNDVLRRSFGEVAASRGRGKSRLLVAQDPLRAAANRAAITDPWPRRVHLDELGMTIAAHGGVFAGASLDLGTRVLLGEMDAAVPTARVAVDLGSGNGVIATEIARRRPGLRVIATDVSAVAVASSRMTADLNGVGDRVRTVRSDAGDELDEGSAQLVLCNPPFHADTTVSTDAAEAMFRNAATILQSGGELWCVWNSHLRYRPVLEKTVGPTRQITRTDRFTVTASRRS
ncbi:16S rRNA (guanine1207-N2)-methyltransferase [Curtobacterium sp. PhB130]|uniref:class I SAM-dependent methyltransferase n=1 Tax=unclassified Curtobacterium TaxID=257496 RepID=UPI000F9E658E|nr:MULTISPECIES: class I SAM-dependent methyltransferase [unclassified Curtobacterium]ROP65132.1 16S rRNA (guanine1207-N2)-methyltransferase [Curtobacterium sp. ZW137]ROS78285.1 16S rRNA (guanine1207-N2)-methyltransferase [Curtobacterium sp. PhB130]TCK65398.1 16S rRNA (guanine1207-N2)-methyltransferase [Curtobacterium sp. PhB136]